MPRLFHVFASFGPGGVPIRISNVINRIGADFHHVIAALDGDLSCRSRLDPGLNVTLLHPNMAASGFVGRMRRIADVLGAQAPDLLITYNWGAIEWALVNRFVMRRDHIHMESGFGSEEADGQILRRVMFRRLALARARRIVVPSHVLAGIARDVWRLSAGKIERIPNGVDCDRFDVMPDAVPRAGVVPGFEKRSNEVIVGTVAPLRPEKNVARLIDAYSDLTDTVESRLLIVGDGSQRDHLELLARDRGNAGRVVFAGHVERVEEVLGLIDVFAITSDTEQMPNALLQAMAAGRAVVGTDVGDVAAMVAEENRPFIRARDDAAGLREAMARLMADGRLRARLGAANRRRALSEYALPRMLERYEATVFAPLRLKAKAAEMAEAAR